MCLEELPERCKLAEMHIFLIYLLIGVIKERIFHKWDVEN